MIVIQLVQIQQPATVIVAVVLVEMELLEDNVTCVLQELITCPTLDVSVSWLS